MGQLLSLSVNILKSCLFIFESPPLHPIFDVLFLTLVWNSQWNILRIIVQFSFMTETLHFNSCLEIVSSF